MACRISSALRIVTIAVILLAVAWITHVRWLTALGDFLVRAEPPHAADAALVLGGDETGLRILLAGDLMKWPIVWKFHFSGMAYGQTLTSTPSSRRARPLDVTAILPR